MAENEFRIVIENEGGLKLVGVADEYQPRTKAKTDEQSKNILGMAQGFVNSVPFGGTVSQVIGQAQGLANGASNLLGGAGAMGIALTALKIAKSAHEIASTIVKDKRQSKELQRRAGIYRRNER